MVLKTATSGVLPGIAHLSHVEEEIKERQARELKEKLDRVRQKQGPKGVVSVDGEPIAPVPIGINPNASTLEKLNGPNGVEAVREVQEKVNDWLDGGRKGDIRMPVVSNYHTPDGDVTRVQQLVVSEGVANKTINKHHNAKVMPVSSTQPVSLTPASFSDSEALTAAVVAAQVQAAKDRNPGVETPTREATVKLPDSLAESLSGQAQKDAEGMQFHTILAPLRPKNKVSDPPPERHLKTSFCDFQASPNAQQIRVEQRVVDNVTQRVYRMGTKVNGEVRWDPI